MKRTLELIQFFLRLTATIVWIITASILSFSFAIVRWGNPDNNRFFGYIYGPIARWILGIELVVEGEEHIHAHQPCIYTPNHQSGIDMAVMQTLYPRNTVMIGKKEVIFVPIWGLLYVAFGNIRIDRSNRAHAFAGLDAAVAQMKKKGLSIWIMPEGTRNRTGEGLLPFKKGPFHMAIQAQCPVVPVVAASMGRFINFTTKIAKGGKYCVRMLPPIETKGMGPGDVERLANLTRERMLEALEELNRRSIPNT